MNQIRKFGLHRSVKLDSIKNNSSGNYGFLPLRNILFSKTEILSDFSKFAPPSWRGSMQQD
jgi:hypothetical protein